MSDINTITLIGICGKDPEFVTFENDTKLTKFTLAVKRYDRKSNDNITDWHNVETFSKLGEYVKKGSKVCVEGSLEINSYVNKKGDTVKNYVIKARNIQLLSPQKTEESQDKTIV